MAAAKTNVEKHGKLLNMLIEFNHLVKFSAVYSKSGDIECSQRDNITNIISFEETKASIVRADESWRERAHLSENDVGRGMYTITAYEKLKELPFP